MESVFLGPKEFQGRYTREEGLIFDKKPNRSWQYMATGTGCTGVAVLAYDPIILQINHEGSINERGYLCVPARVHISMDGRPFLVANRENAFKMKHSLQTSTISISGDDVEIRIRAHMEYDLICVEVEDRREKKLPISIYVETPYLSNQYIDGNTGAWWHENGNETIYHQVNKASGMESDYEFSDPLKNRTFGVSIATESGISSGNGWKLKPQERHTFYIAARSGVDITKDKLIASVKNIPTNEVFNKTHLEWFKQFWSKVWFIAPDKRMDNFTVAYDFYRYFTAVSSGVNREFPLRFQMDLLKGNLEENVWSTMLINAVQSYQAYFGIYRNGDWDALKSLERWYFDNRAFLEKYSKSHRKHDGFFIPYECNPFGTAHYSTGFPGESAKSYKYLVDEFMLYSIEDHIYQMYSFEHGLAIMWLLSDAAIASGNETEFFEKALPFINGLVIFFLNEYKIGEDGKICFYPATSGESWFKCKNPSSWIALFKMFLPRISKIAKKYGYEPIIENCEKLLSVLPEIPIGRWDNADSSVDVILPAEDFSRHEPINFENPELYAIWPYGLYGLGKPDYELALNTYKNRKNQNWANGWNLDCIWAACLGLADEAAAFTEWQFPTILKCPGGFSFETAPTHPEYESLPMTPSMQGMGNSVCALYEMLCHDNDGELLLLPGWPAENAVSAAFYTASAGRVEIEYCPGSEIKFKTQRPVKVKKWL